MMWVRFKISVEFVEHRAHVFRAYTAPVRKFEVVTFGSCDVFFFFGPKDESFVKTDIELQDDLKSDKNFGYFLYWG